MNALEKLITSLELLHKSKTQGNKMYQDKKPYSQYFEKAFRHVGEKEDPKSFIRLKDDAPSSLKSFIRDIHFRQFEGALPNDWIYATILEAFEMIQDEDNSLEDINIEADPYYYDLWQWLGEPFAHGICNEYLEEYAPKTQRIYELIAGGQWLAMDKIYREVAEFLEVNHE
jgi:hypothetical protein